MNHQSSYGNILSEIQMNGDEIEYVVNTIKSMPSDGKMVEWGCGGSTCKWIETLTDSQSLITIEHNESWYDRVTRAIKAEFGDVSDKFTFKHVGEMYGFEHGYATPLEEHPLGTDKYINPDIEGFFDADVFFIDGIARAACSLVTLLKHTKKDPVIFIHDYVGREAWYDWATQFFDVEVVGKAENKSTLLRLYVKK